MIHSAGLFGSDRSGQVNCMVRIGQNGQAGLVMPIGWGWLGSCVVLDGSAGRVGRVD